MSSQYASKGQSGNTRSQKEEVKLDPNDSQSMTNSEKTPRDRKGPVGTGNANDTKV